MLDFIINIDQKLFLILNHLNSDFLDHIMLFASDSYIPGILILSFLIFFGYKHFKKHVVIAVFMTLLSFGLSDSISSRIFKPTFERLRPCHEPKIQAEVYTAGKKCWGGKFGFVSSHAANYFSIATFIFLIFSTYTKKTFVLFIWSALVSYSRIYLGKHYPLDIFCGGILGILCGFIIYKLFKTIPLKTKSFYLDQ